MMHLGRMFQQIVKYLVNAQSQLIQSNLQKTNLFQFQTKNQVNGQENTENI